MENDGQHVALVSTGTCTLTGDHPGNGTWLPAPQAVTSFEVLPVAVVASPPVAVGGFAVPLAVGGLAVAGDVIKYLPKIRLFKSLARGALALAVRADVAVAVAVAAELALPLKCRRRRRRRRPRTT